MIHYLGEDETRHERAMRFLRDDALRASDWTQLPDNGLSDSDRQAWATYRQQLRDFPATWVPSETADFPEVPE
jgi:hypothetical protein